MMCHVELANPPNPFPKQNKKKRTMIRATSKTHRTLPTPARTSSSSTLSIVNANPGDRGRPVFTIYARCPHKARWESQPPSEKV